MEENKNLTPENEILEQETASEALDTSKKGKGAKKTKAKKEKRPKKLRNQAFLKRGSYSLAITAAVIAGAIVLNILVGALANRFVLEFDMSTEKTNSISQENIDYIKNVEDEITVTVCATKEDYASYMSYYSQQYEVSDSAATPYYEQTVKLIEKYAAYNNKITVNFLDTQSTAFSEIVSRYPNETINYGDIIVSSTKNNVERHKKVGFKDIYGLAQDSTYASYGYTMYTVSSNKLETALTSAIAYVTSAETKKIGIYTGHSAYDYTADYQSMLKDNNYELEVISDSILTSVPNNLDALIIASPTADFISSELDAIAAFLDNGGKLDKGLIFFGDINSPYLTNFYEFLEEWGITVEDGVLFETNSNNHMPEEPMTLGTYPTGDDSITDGMSYCITGYNIPMKPAFESQGSIKVTSLMATPQSVVAAPKGTENSWTGADDYTKQSFSGVIQAVKSDYDDDNNEIASYVMAFSSIEYIDSEYSEQSSVSNKNMTLAAAERAAGAQNTGISFISKTITDESYADKVTQASANTIRIIFMFILPIGLIIIGIYIYIKRRNA